MSTRILDQEPLDAIVQQIAQLERYLRRSSIEGHLLHLVKLRVSQINGCAFCLAMHTRDLLQRGRAGRQDCGAAGLARNRLVHRARTSCPGMGRSR